MSWRRCLLLTGVLLGCAACGHYEEIARLPSPDGRVDAVVVEVEAGSGKHGGNGQQKGKLSRLHPVEARKDPSKNGCCCA